MPKLPWFKFNPSWWITDTDLTKCTPATRGVWIDLLCAMHQSGRSGELSGTTDQIARLARCSTAELTQALTELQTTGTADVTFRNNNVTVVNRLMKREAKERKDNSKRQERFREKGGGDPDRWTYIRAKILLLDDKKCAYCGRKATTVDHVIPRTQGGDENENNLVACCKTCNCSKNNRTPIEAKMKFHSAFTRLNINELFGSNVKSNMEVTREKKEDKKIESNKGAHPLLESNLYRQPNIPTFDQVKEVFFRQGGTIEQAEKFFQKYEATGWFTSNSPIKNFANLVPGYLSIWKKNELSKGTGSSVPTTQSAPPLKKM